VDSSRVAIGLGLLAWGTLVAFVFRWNMREAQVRKNLEVQWRWFHRWRGVPRDDWLKSRERAVRLWTRYGWFVFGPFFAVWFAACIWTIVEGL